MPRHHAPQRQRQHAPSHLWHRANFNPVARPRYEGHFFEVPDDGVVSLNLLTDGAALIFTGKFADEEAVIVWVNTLTIESTVLIAQGAAGWATASGIPTGTTGGPGKTTIYADAVNGQVHLENRQGTVRDYAWALLAGFVT